MVTKFYQSSLLLIDLTFGESDLGNLIFVIFVTLDLTDRNGLFVSPLSNFLLASDSFDGSALGNRWRWILFVWLVLATRLSWDSAGVAGCLQKVYGVLFVLH